jgi:hypothetical protein
MQVQMLAGLTPGDLSSDRSQAASPVNSVSSDSNDSSDSSDGGTNETQTQTPSTHTN